MKRILKFCFVWLLGLGLASAWAQKGMDQININGQFLLAARAGQVHHNMASRKVSRLSRQIAKLGK